MSRSKAELAVVLGLVFAVSWAASAQGPVEVLQGIAAALQRQPVWTADYVQEYLPAGMTEGDEERGTLTLAWPDHALFIAGDPPVRLMGMVGRAVRLLDLEVPSCDDHQLTREEWERTPLIAILEPQRAVERFSVALEGSTLVLRPRNAGGVSRLAVTVDDKGLPAQVTIEDAAGAVNRLTFSRWRRGASPAGGWLPPPPGGLVCSQDVEPGG